MRRWLRTVHAWAGIVAALLVAVIALSGAALVFKDDYLQASLPRFTPAEPDESAARLGELAATAERSFPGQMRSIVFADTRLRLHRAYLRDGGGAYLDGAGVIVERWRENGRLEVWLFDLHERLLLGASGHTTAGCVALALITMVMTGVLLWLPGARAFAWRLWPRSTARRDLLAQHRDFGILVGTPLLFVALTGAALVFPTQAKSFLNLLLSPGSSAAVAPAHISCGVASATAPPDWEQILSRARARFPTAELRVLSWPGQDGLASVRLKQPGEWHPNGRTRVALCANDRRVVVTEDALADTRGGRAYNAVYPLHAAKIGGRPYDVFIALCGLALAVLALIGAGSFLRLRLRRR